MNATNQCLDDYSTGTVGGGQQGCGGSKQGSESMQQQQQLLLLEDRQLGATQDEVRHIMSHVLKGLLAMHGARIIHRDIKTGELQTAHCNASGCPGSNTPPCAAVVMT
jgi:hypothetical protein